MGSPTQGMWECRHGVDGRDHCEECLQTEVEPVATMELARTIMWLYEDATSLTKDMPQEVIEMVDWANRFIHWMQGTSK